MCEFLRTHSQFGVAVSGPVLPLGYSSPADDFAPENCRPRRDSVIAARPWEFGATRSIVLATVACTAGEVRELTGSVPCLMVYPWPPPVSRHVPGQNFGRLKINLPSPCERGAMAPRSGWRRASGALFWGDSAAGRKLCSEAVDHFDCRATTHVEVWICRSLVFPLTVGQGDSDPL